MNGSTRTAERERFFMLSLDMLCIAGFDGFFKDLNPAWERTLGYSIQELLDRPYVEFIHADDQAATRSVAEHLIATGEPQSFENRLRCKDGTYRWFLWSCVASKDERLHYGIARDITGRKEREIQSRLYKAIFANSSDAITILDLEGRVIEQNEAHRALLGYSDAELAGHTPAIHTGESAFDRALGIVRSCGRYREEVVNRTRDGREVTVDLSAFEVRNEQGARMCFVGIKRDITRTKMAAQELARANARVKDSLAEKEALLKEVNHRVKNNLQVISSLLNLQSTYVRDPRTLEALRDCQNRIKAMALVHEKLYRSTDLTRIDARSFLQELTTNVMRSHAPVGSHPDLMVDVDDVALRLDTAIPCGLVVNELVSNALKHAFPSGGRGQVEVSLHARGEGQFLLTVRDDGVGLPVGIDVTNSSSLGLQLVASLAQQLGGTLTVEHQGGAGFMLTFSEAGSREPRADDEP